MDKIKINVNGEEMEVDFDTLDKETADKLGINFHIDNEKKKNKKLLPRKFRHKITGITPFVILIAFFLTGFLLDAWKWNWSLFFLIPIVSVLVNIRFSKLKSAINAFLILLIIAAYIVSGIVFQIWAWNWVIFFLIPIVSILLGD